MIFASGELEVIAQFVILLKFHQPLLELQPPTVSVLEALLQSRQMLLDPHVQEPRPSQRQLEVTQVLETILTSWPFNQVLEQLEH